MRCKNCDTEVFAQERFCPCCGQMMEQEPPQRYQRNTQTGNLQNSNLRNSNDTGREPAPVYDDGAFSPVYPVVTEKPKKKMDLMIVVIILLSVLIVLALGLGILWVTNGNNNESAETRVVYASSPATVMPYDTPAPYTTPSASPSTHASSSPSVSPTPRVSATPTSNPVVKNPSYKRVENRSNGYVYEVPAHFEESLWDEDVYEAPDGTAIVRFEANLNGDGASAKSFLPSSNTDGYVEVDYTASGADWFAFSGIRTDGVSVYCKGLLQGDDVYTFMFETEEQYLKSHYYSDYIEYMEDHFKRLN